MSSETSSGSFEVVDLQLKFQSEKSYYPSQHPMDSTGRVVQSSSQEHLSSQGPTECTSGVEVATLELPKVEELARNLVIATKENERFRIAMEECNKSLSKQVETTEGRNREIENLKTALENYKAKNTELEENIKLLQEQLSSRPAPESWGHQQAMSQSADETDYSTSDAAAALREQVAGYTEEIEQLKKINNDLQQSQSLLEYEHDQLKQEHQKLLEDNRNQSQYSGGHTQSKGDVSELEQGMERMNLSQSAIDELEEENRRLKLKIQMEEEEIDKLKKEAFQYMKNEFVMVPSDAAKRTAQTNKLLKTLENFNTDNEKLKKEMIDIQVEMSLLKENDERHKKDKMALQEELDKERTRVRSYSASSTDLETENRKLATEKSKLQKMHSQVSSDYSKTSEELEDTRKDLQRVNEELSRRQQELQTKEWERTELMGRLEQLEMNNKQLDEQLRSTSRNLDQALDSLKHHRQESETISSRASEAQHQLLQEKEQLDHQLQDARVERDKLLEQLREAYSEKEKSEGQKQMLSQNLNVLQSQEEDYKKEKEGMLVHIQQLNANLKASDQKLNETIGEYQMAVQDLETTVQRKMALEGELKKLREHYTQVNNERNQLKRMVDEKDKEIEELIGSKNKIVQDNSDSMELMRNQLQQYARDYEEERVAREKFAQQMMKLDKSIKEKDEEIDHLQEQLTKYGGNMLNTTVGGGSNLFGQDHKRRSGDQRRPDMPEPGDFPQRKDQWSGNNKVLDRNPSASLKGADDVFTASYPPNTRQPVTMSHPPRPDPSSSANNRMFGPYGNVPLNTATGGGGAGMHTGQPQPDLNSSRRSAYTEYQQPYAYGQDHNNPPNRPGPNMPEHGGDFNARSEGVNRYPSDPASNRGPNMGMQLPNQPPNSNLDAMGGGPPTEPCPLCGKRFPTIEELSQHAALCNF